MSADTIRIGSKTYTRSRAQALGFLDADGNLLDTVPRDSQAARIIERDRRRAQWAERQGLPRPAVAGGNIETTEDGLLKITEAPEPLRPGNVTKDGEPITDEETLAAIAARTAAIEAGEPAPEVPAPPAITGEGGVAFGFGEAMVEEPGDIGAGEVVTFLSDVEADALAVSSLADLTAEADAQVAAAKPSRKRRSDA